MTVFPKSRLFPQPVRMELSMSDTKTVSPLRQRMIEDMAARKLNPHTQRGHISSCKRFAAWLKRSPDTATPDEARRFQLYLDRAGLPVTTRQFGRLFKDAAKAGCVILRRCLCIRFATASRPICLSAVPTFV